MRHRDDFCCSGQCFNLRTIPNWYGVDSICLFPQSKQNLRGRNALDFSSSEDPGEPGHKREPRQIVGQFKGHIVHYESLNWNKGSLWWQTDLNDPLRNTEAVELTNFLILQPTTSAEECDMRFLHFLPTQTQLMR